MNNQLHAIPCELVHAIEMVGVKLHFANAYNRPKPEVEKYGSMLAVCLWVLYERIGGINCPSLPNGNVGLGVI
jgi:hypothetical protein